MPNYIQSQSPWMAAAQGMGQVAEPLARLYSELPRVRMQMQHHADQMGIQQGRLNLEEQELGMRAPVFNAQANNYQAGADKDTAAKNNLVQQLAFAMQAAQGAGTNPLAQALAGSMGMNPAASQRGYTAMTQPMVLNQNQSAMDPQTFQLLAQGMMNAPIGNNVRAATPGGTEAPVLQTGQFRPPGNTALDPSTQMRNYMSALEGLRFAGLPPATTESLKSLILSNALGAPKQTQPVGTNQPAKIKAIRQIQ